MIKLALIDNGIPYHMTESVRLLCMIFILILEKQEQILTDLDLNG